MTLQDFVETMIGDLKRECLHMNFYLYHASAVTGPHALTFKEFFTDAAKSEMRHVQQFLDRLFGLNAQPLDLASASFIVSPDVSVILDQACRLEREVVENYTTRLAQLEAISGAWPAEAAYLTIFYEDQIKDSYEDCERMRRMLANISAQ
jgi:bacterioferritin (cytochrome b1)